MKPKTRPYHLVEIPSLGVCTLLSLRVLPPHLWCYRNLLETAQLLGLKELPKQLDERVLVHIYLGLATTTGASSIWISGVHDGYHTINITLPEKDQRPEPCITCFELTQLEKNFVEMSGVRQLPIDELWHLEPGEVCYTLFSGSADA